MKKLFLVIIAALFVSGCAINSNDDIFSKKKECAELRAGIEQHLMDLNSGTERVQLNKIFYSPKENTCLYTMTTNTVEGEIRRSYYDLYDALTNEKVASEVGCLPRDICEKDPTQASEDFDALIKKYE